jgi:hypothetical protein
MRSGIATCAGAIACALLATANVQAQPAPAQPAPAEPQYLMFQVFTATPDFTTTPGAHVISALPADGFLDAKAAKLLSLIGTRGDAFHRLGIMVGPLALDYTDAQMRALIARSFAFAVKYRLAIGLHIDDSKFWANRRDLWGDPANVEWRDWQGTPNTGQYLNWGEPWKLAPQACFNSPAMLREARRVAGQVIGPAIAEQLARLRASGDQALFAGVIVGWETAIGRDFDTGGDLGYCALHNLGYSAASPPPDRDAALQSVVRNWIGTWATALADGGVPSDRIYAHIAFMSRKQYDDTKRSDGPSYARTVLYTPPAVAFGQAYRPGFTTYADADIFDDIYAALAAHGNPPWASAEGTNVDIQSVPFAVSDQGMQDYLARMFNHGAAMTNVFGFDIGEPDNLFRQATENPEAVAAYRKFLGGAHLDETPLAQSYHRNQSPLQAIYRVMRALPTLIGNVLRGLL